MRPIKEASTLAKKGFKVMVLAQKYGDIQSYENRDGIEIVRISTAIPFLGKIRSLFKKIVRKNHVSRIRSSTKSINDKRLSSFKYMYSWIIYKIKYFNFLLKHRFDIYHVHAPDSLPIAHLFAFIRKAKLIYEAHELYAQMKKTQNYPRILFLLGVLLEKFYIKKADYTIVVSNSIANYLENKYMLKRTTVILNCPSYVKFNDYIKTIHDRLKLPHDCKIVLSQSRTISKVRGLDKLIEATKYIKTKEKFYIVIMGSGEHMPKLKELVSKKGVCGRVKFLPPVSKDILLSYTASADVGVCLTQNLGLNYYFSLPNKLFEYAMAGVPVIVSNFPEMAAIVEKNKIGKAVSPDNPKDIGDTISRLLNNPGLRKEYRRNALNVAKNQYNWKKEQEKLLKIYYKL